MPSPTDQPAPVTATLQAEAEPASKRREKVLLTIHSGDAETFCFVLKTTAEMYEKKGIPTFVRNGKNGMEIFSLEPVR